ncbi:MAG: Trm112 family protein [Terriglobales bacterium]
MAIPAELLEILVCPDDHAKVRLLGDQSGLQCERCSRIYPVRDGIPVMLIEEAIRPDATPSRNG